MTLDIPQQTKWGQSVVWSSDTVISHNSTHLRLEYVSAVLFFTAFSLKNLMMHQPSINTSVWAADGIKISFQSFSKPTLVTLLRYNLSILLCIHTPPQSHIHSVATTAVIAGGHWATTVSGVATISAGMNMQMSTLPSVTTPVCLCVSFSFVYLSCASLFVSSHWPVAAPLGHRPPPALRQPKQRDD